MLMKLFLFVISVAICNAEYEVNWDQVKSGNGGGPTIYNIASEQESATTTGEPEHESGDQGISVGVKQSVQTRQETELPTKKQSGTKVMLQMTTPEFTRFQQNLRMFAAALYYNVMKDAPEENVFFSPLSISHAMGMINTGAQGNSSSQIKKSLRMEMTDSNHFIDTGFKRTTQNKFSPRKSDVKVLMAARSFIAHDFTILESYANSLQIYYNSIIESMNFTDSKKSSDRINGWVEEQTRGLIKDLIVPDSITSATTLILVNTLYFKAPWTRLFDELPPDDFTTPTGTVKVPYISQKVICRRKELKGYEYVAIPYKDEEAFCVIIMPKTKKDMEEFESKENLSAFFKLLKRRVTKDWPEQHIKLYLPKFTFERSMDVKKMLKAMGVHDIFSNTDADLGGMSDEFIYVSDFLHKAKITVNKDGTEAAAATAVLTQRRTISETKEVRINRAFIFVVYERGNILFFGKTNNPSLK